MGPRFSTVAQVLSQFDKSTAVVWIYGNLSAAAVPVPAEPGLILTRDDESLFPSTEKLQ